MANTNILCRLGNIAFGFDVCARARVCVCVCVCVCACACACVCVRRSRFYYVFCNVSTMHAMVLKFHIWIPYGKQLTRTLFPDNFLVSDLCPFADIRLKSC